MSARLGRDGRALLLAGIGVLILCLGLFPRGAHAQTTFYDEDFSSYSVGDTSPGDGAWQRDISSITLDSEDHFSVQNPTGSNKLFGAKDLDGEAIWLTDTLDISSYSSVDFSLTATQSGTHESSDYFDVEYSTDGGASYTLVTDWNGNGSSSHTLTGNWTNQTVTKTGLSGSNLIVRVTMNNSSNSEFLRLDDVSVTGKQEPIIQFTETGSTVNEGDGSTNLVAEIRYPDGNSVSVDVAFNDANSSAGTGDIANSGDFPKTVTFSSSANDGDTKTVSVDLNDDTDSEGLETAQFDLTNLSTSGNTSIGPVSSFDLDIQDNDLSNIAITEVMQNPDDVSDSNGEWFEVYNSTTSSIDLNNWTIGDAGGTDHTIGSSVSVPAKGFAVLCKNADSGTNGGFTCDYAYSGVTFSNTSDEIILNNGSGTEIDRIEYDGGPNWPDPTGASMVFTGTALNNNGSKWTTASARARSYPGTSGSDTGSPGRNGEGQDLQPNATVNGNAGWRMLSTPVTGRTVSDLTKHNLVQGISGLQYADGDANVYTGWDGSSWTKPTGSDALTKGRGFIWYFYDSAGQIEEVDPLPFDLSLRGTQPSGNVQVTGLTDGQTWHVLGNPYPTAYDISSLNLMGQGFQTTVQIWDPSANSYETVTQSGDNSDLIASWQGFFVERSSNGNTTLTFDDAGKSSGDPIFYQREPKAQPPRVELRLVGRNQQGAQRTRDDGAMVHFRTQATPGWDLWDASKLTPLVTPYAVLALQGPDEGETVQQAVRSLPRALPDSGYTVPIALNRAGTNEVSTYTVSWPSLKNVPDEWALRFTDTKADTTIDLRADEQYEFEAERGKREQGSSSNRTPDPLPVVPRRLAKRSDSARFALRVVRSDELPVELASVEASVRDQRAVLSWETVSETENAGFEIQHKVDGRFQRVGFVEGAGTTERVQRYRYRTDRLPVGPHAFRLVQRDVDGTIHTRETIEVDVGLEKSHVLQAPYPNPFRGTATLAFAVNEPQEVTVTLYNTLGQRVQTVYRGTPPEDQLQRVQIDGKNLASGLYFVRMLGETVAATRRLTHLE